MSYKRKDKISEEAHIQFRRDRVVKNHFKFNSKLEINKRNTQKFMNITT